MKKNAGNVLEVCTAETRDSIIANATKGDIAQTKGSNNTIPRVAVRPGIAPKTRPRTRPAKTPPRTGIVKVIDSASINASQAITRSY